MLTIKEGRVYVTRKGQRVAVVSDAGRPGELFNGTNGVTYHENGRVCDGWRENVNHPHDIVDVSRHEELPDDQENR